MIGKKENILFLVLAGFFITNALVAELIGTKLFSVERWFGFEPLDLKVLGNEHLALTMSAGSLLWPVVFVMTDIINEYYGAKGVRLLTFITAGLILYAFFMIFWALNVPPSDVWYAINPDVKPDINYAYNKVLGQGMTMIFASIMAFLVSQVLDVWVFQRLRKITGENKLWLRALGSTVVSQLVDSFIVGFVAFYIFGDLSFGFIIALLVVSYPYKFIVATLMTPIIYLVHFAVDKYLGKERAHALTVKASKGEW